MDSTWPKLDPPLALIPTVSFTQDSEPPRIAQLFPLSSDVKSYEVFALNTSQTLYVSLLVHFQSDTPATSSLHHFNSLQTALPASNAPTHKLLTD
jgi:hypothetical protein